MKQTLDPNQISFFNHHSYLELEGLLKETDTEKLLQLTKGRPVQKCRDLFTQDDWIRALCLRKSFAHFAKELFDKPFLRLAFDHAIYTSDQGVSPFRDTLSLNSCCSFQTLTGALILRLTETTPLIIEPKAILCPLPQKRGNGIFFPADIPIDWTRLLSLSNEAFHLIAYCPLNTLYVYNPEDPLTHALKRDGYGFGDHLQGDRHPVIK